MFSFERAFSAVAALGLSMVLFAGCQTPRRPVESTAPTMPASVPPVTHTNQVQLPPDSGDNMKPNILAWDATEKTYRVQPGELRAPFTFSLTNISPGPVVIYDTSTTCDCTVASLPSKPWIVQSGGTGQIQASVDLHKKSGMVTNSVIVFTSQGNRRLKVKAILPNE